MPYINEEDRKALLEEEGIFPTKPGELNFILTKLCLEYAGDAPGYETYNSIVGVLECCKLEFYRRAVAPYEDIKKETNGDVY